MVASENAFLLQICLHALSNTFRLNVSRNNTINNIISFCWNVTAGMFLKELLDMLW